MKSYLENAIERLAEQDFDEILKALKLSYDDVIDIILDDISKSMEENILLWYEQYENDLYLEYLENRLAI